MPRWRPCRLRDHLTTGYNLLISHAMDVNFEPLFKMAVTPSPKLFVKRPLQAPRLAPLPLSYAQATRMKSEVEVRQPGSNKGG
jgi:hypothetical protein